jgi:hypothetical protein
MSHPGQDLLLRLSEHEVDAPAEILDRASADDASSVLLLAAAPLREHLADFPDSPLGRWVAEQPLPSGPTTPARRAEGH